MAEFHALPVRLPGGTGSTYEHAEDNLSAYNDSKWAPPNPQNNARNFTAYASWLGRTYFSFGLYTLKFE